MSIRLIRSCLKARFARRAYGDISMRLSSSSLAEDVEAEGTFFLATEEALLSFSEEGGCSLVCGFDIPIFWDVVEEVAELAVFLVAEAFSGSTVEVSAIVCDRSSGVTRTHFSPLRSILVLETALMGLVAQGVLLRMVGGSSSISSAIVWLLPDPATPKMSALMSLVSTYPCDIASSNSSWDLSLAV